MNIWVMERNYNIAAQGAGNEEPRRDDSMVDERLPATWMPHEGSPVGTTAW
jgi:hypothetical protein